MSQKDALRRWLLHNKIAQMDCAENGRAFCNPRSGLDLTAYWYNCVKKGLKILSSFQNRKSESLTCGKTQNCLPIDYFNNLRKEKTRCIYVKPLKFIIWSTNLATIPILSAVVVLAAIPSCAHSVCCVSTRSAMASLRSWLKTQAMSVPGGRVSLGSSMIELWLKLM